jgi:hypothetical protein
VRLGGLLLDLFEEANGRPTSSVKELEKWARSRDGRALLAAHLDENGKITPLSDAERQAHYRAKRAAGGVDV